MNKTLVKVMNGVETTVNELFEVINQNRYSTITLMDGSETMFSMEVDHVEQIHDYYEFSQTTTTDCLYRLAMNDIVSVAAEVVDAYDFLFIDCILKDELHFKVVVYQISRIFMGNPNEHRREIDVFDLKDYVESLYDPGQRIVAKLENTGGLNMRTSVEKIQLNECEEGYHLKIADGNSTQILIPLYGETESPIFIQESGIITTITILPYLMPFTEVSISVIG